MYGRCNDCGKESELEEWKGQYFCKLCVLDKRFRDRYDNYMQQQKTKPRPKEHSVQPAISNPHSNTPSYTQSPKDAHKRTQNIIDSIITTVAIVVIVIIGIALFVVGIIAFLSYMWIYVCGIVCLIFFLFVYN